MNKSFLILTFITLLSFGCKEKNKENTINSTPNTEIDKTLLKEKEPQPEIIVKPINHASFILEYEDIVIYVDPVGGPELYKNEKKPSVVLITDIHEDHFDLETFEGIMTDTAQPITPPDVAIKIPEALEV